VRPEREKGLASPTRAPEMAEHTDTILSERGLTVEELIELKIDGAAL